MNGNEAEQNGEKKMKTIQDVFGLEIHSSGNGIAEVGDGMFRFYVKLSALNEIASEELIDASESTDENDDRYMKAYDSWCIANNISKNLWTIRASHRVNGTLLDCSSPEILGDDFLFFGSEHEAEEKAKEMESEQSEFGLSGIMYEASLV